jgi:hypothetical protein
VHLALSAVRHLLALDKKQLVALAKKDTGAMVALFEELTDPAGDVMTVRNILEAAEARFAVALSAVEAAAA